MVREAMACMGDPSEFGTLPPPSSDEEPEKEVCVRRRLYRSRRDSAVAGICGGLSEFFGVDVTLLRLITLFLILFGGLSLWVYIVLWIIIPLEPRMLKCR
ncbi:MAG: PspC domain-containing protein [Alistipes sp.]|nr:PspC domain-containing protein [Alistipes sp.]